MNRISVACAVVALALPFAAVADGKAGKAKWDAACADCHEVSEYAGQPVADLTKTLKALVADTIKHKPKLKLTDAEIANLAAFLSTAK